MAGLLVDVKLKVLMVHQEATSSLEYGVMSIVGVSAHVQVSTLC